ncbi:condensation domain-containing protein [Nostoc sp.]|uniref:condensation domain-containing protein n=1 Tax=Nostoc sp. TaxID=1180 RepID=UPI002FFA8297
MKTENIEDIYELSPVQQGILFHSLLTPELALYFIQLSYTLRGNLNIHAFGLAWQQVATRHPILRTGFYWEQLDKPLQVVHKKITIPLEQQDWRGIDPVEEEEQFQSFLASDRQKNFDFSQPPLMRLTLIRLSDDSYQFVLSKHHLILDGWSSALVMKDFIQIYETLCQRKNTFLAPSSPFGDYIAWLQKQDLSQAEKFWRQMLEGVRSPTSLNNLNTDNLSNSEQRYDEQQIKLSAAITTSLQSLARQHQLTLNTLIQGAWAILLSRYSCQKNVVYGCTVSARPVDLVGVESMAGTFVNTLPVQVNVDGEQYLLLWLQQLQNQQVEMRQYEYTPLVDIQGWSEVPRGMPLFESFVVFENYPIDQVLRKWESDLEIQNISTLYKTNYPINIVIQPSSKLDIGISYDCCRFDVSTINSILKHFEILLQSIVNNPTVRLKNLKVLSEKEQQIFINLEKEIKFDFNFLKV